MMQLAITHLETPRPSLLSNLTLFQEDSQDADFMHDTADSKGSHHS